MQQLLLRVWLDISSQTIEEEIAKSIKRQNRKTENLCFLFGAEISQSFKDNLCAHNNSELNSKCKYLSHHDKGCILAVSLYKNFISKSNISAKPGYSLKINDILAIIYGGVIFLAV